MFYGKTRSALALQTGLFFFLRFSSIAFERYPAPKTVHADLLAWGFNSVGWVQAINDQHHRHSRSFTPEEYRWLNMPYGHLLPFIESHQWEIESLIPKIHSPGLQSCAMAQLLVLYNTPADPTAFERHYHQTHIPMANRIPGLRKYTINKGPVQALSGTAPHLIAILDFDSMADIQAALASPEGQAAAGDLPNFASGGATLLIYDNTAV